MRHRFPAKQVLSGVSQGIVQWDDEQALGR